MRWPWQSRHYLAITDALRFAEQALAEREQAATEQRHAIDEVRQELNKGDRK